MSTPFLRLPDQFRPSRNVVVAGAGACACCCCCCCCATTLVSSTIVLPMQVEILGRRHHAAAAPGTPVSPESLRQLRPLKVAAAAAPLLAIAGGFAAGALTGSEVAFFPAALALLLVFLLAVFAPFRDGPAHGILAAVVITVAFVLEIVAGAFLVLFTYGFGYLVFAALAVWLIVRRFRARLLALRGGPPPPPPPPPPEPPRRPLRGR